MTDVGEVRVRITADASQLDREMSRARNVVQQGAGGMTTAFGGLKSQLLSLAPAISSIAFVQFGKQAIDAAGHINDLAQRIGFAAETLSALEIPLAAGGASLDEFTGSINRMNNILGEAAKGSEEAVKAFDSIGLSVDKLRTLSPEEQFYEIASALGGIKDQSVQTEAGMNIFGRSFATLLPLLKEYGGNMRDAVEAQKELNQGLSKETIERVDEFGDSLSAVGIRIRNVYLEAFAAILQVIDAIPRAKAAIDDSPARMANGTASAINAYDDGQPTSGFKFGQSGGGTRTLGPHTDSSLEEVASKATGNNSYLLGGKSREDAAKKIASAREALDDYNRSLREESALLGMSKREADGQEARFRVEEIARKGGITLTKEQIEANADLAASNYDLKESQEAINKAVQEAARFQQELHDKLAQTFTDIAFRAGSATDAVLDFANAIARAAFEKRVAGPLADAFIGSGGNKGILDDAIGGIGKFFGGFFADGGSPPVGVPSIVGERGPEIFVPGTSGTIIPNHQIGRATVIVHQTIQINPGVPELINAKIREAAPVIAAQAHAAVFNELQKGGAGSRISGLRG